MLTCACKLLQYSRLRSKTAETGNFFYHGVSRKNRKIKKESLSSAVPNSVKNFVFYRLICGQTSDICIKRRANRVFAVDSINGGSSMLTCACKLLQYSHWHSKTAETGNFFTTAFPENRKTKKESRLLSHNRLHK